MESLSLDQIKALAQQTQQPSISIFLPMLRTETHQNRIRFKNLAREARQQLLDRNMEPREVDTFLQPAQALADDEIFWDQPDNGLAVFLSPGDFRSYRLPIQVEEQVVIATNYMTAPLMPMFTNNGTFFVLALSQNEVRLFEGTRHSIKAVDMPRGAPQNLAHALRLDAPEKQVQFHSGGGQGGGRASVFHGAGAGEEDSKERIEQFLNQLDASLKPIFRDQKAPLVLAGVEYLLPMYRKTSEYAHIMPEGIVGNPEILGPDELHAQAWPIVEPVFRREIDQVIERYHEFQGVGKSSDSIDEIASAAYTGRVACLITSVGSQVWGRVDEESGRATHHQEQRKGDDVELLNYAANWTMQNSGKVYALPQDRLPTDSPMIAVFRY